MQDPLTGLGIDDVTFIVVACQSSYPPKQQPEPIELAAVGLRRAGEFWLRTAAFDTLIRPPLHAPITSAETADTGITAGLVASKPSAAHVLARLDARLTNPPYLLVSYGARNLARNLYFYREHCPTLALTHLLDTHQLAQTLLPELNEHYVGTVLQHIGLPARIKPHRAVPDLEANVGVFTYLLDLAESAWTSNVLRQMRRIAGMTPPAAVPVQETMF